MECCCVDRGCPEGRPPRPVSKEDVVKWYTEVEKPRGTGLDPATKQTADYFYGRQQQQPSGRVVLVG